MELNERDESTRQRINHLTKRVVAEAFQLFVELGRIECVTAKELAESMGLIQDALATATDVLRCCAMPYADYLKTDRWMIVCQRRKALDGYQCRDCGEMEFLNVHHLTYENRGLESLEDLVTLCDECHRKRHGKN